MFRRTLMKGIPVLLGAAMLCLVPAAAWAAPITVTGQLTTSDPDSAGRPTNTGVDESSCGGAIPTPGVAPATRNYDAYTFQNASGTTATCVTVSVTVLCPETISADAYLGSFDPSNPTANLIGKNGFGFCGPTAASFSFDVPAGATFQIVLIDEGLGSEPYTMVVDGTGAGVIRVPTAVTFRAVTASRTNRGVVVRWTTASELNTLGFQVYRLRGHSWQRITHPLIAAKGSVAGASYRFLDRTARRGVAYRYRIKAVNQDGTASWFGSVRVT